MSFFHDDGRPSDSETDANRVVTAYFEDREAAMRAIERLTAAGISRDAINLVEGHAPDVSEGRLDNGIHERTATGMGHSRQKGFFESLADFFIPDDDRHTYAEGLNRGGHVVTARVGDEHYDIALDILDDDGTVDIGSREEEWRAEGWSPSALAAHQTGAHLGGTNSMATSEENMSVAGMTGAPLAGAGVGAASMGSNPAPQQAHPNPGERDLDHGRSRVRSYTLDEPTSEHAASRRERLAVEVEDERGSTRDTTGTRRT